jgi:hypothetical protein
LQQNEGWLAAPDRLTSSVSSSRASPRWPISSASITFGTLRQRHSTTVKLSSALMEKPAIYTETSIVSYLVARPSRDLIVAAHQQLTVDWWQNQRPNYVLFISQIVIEEARAGDPDSAERRLTAIDKLPLLEVNEEAIQLAQDLIKSHAVPEKAARDALHIGVACVGAMDYLITWNCKHIANAKTRSLIEKTCQSAGYASPIICTPEELED